MHACNPHATRTACAHTHLTIHSNPRPHPPEEDATLLELVGRHGAQNWTLIARQLGGGRNGKSCRLRWFNQLDPRVNKEPFSEEEVSSNGAGRVPQCVWGGSVAPPAAGRQQAPANAILYFPSPHQFNACSPPPHTHIHTLTTHTHALRPPRRSA